MCTKFVKIDICPYGTVDGETVNCIGLQYDGKVTTFNVWGCRFDSSADTYLH